MEIVKIVLAIFAETAYLVSEREKKNLPQGDDDDDGKIFSNPTMLLVE